MKQGLALESRGEESQQTRSYQSQYDETSRKTKQSCFLMSRLVESRSPTPLAISICTLRSSFVGGPSRVHCLVYFAPSTRHLLLCEVTRVRNCLFSPENEYKVKIGKPILKLISHIRLQEFLEMTKVERVGQGFTKPDALRANSHTEAGRIFVTKLRSKSCFVFTDEEYSAWCRSFLGIPPKTTIGNLTEQDGFDYSVQRCLTEHDGDSPFLDADGCHAASLCPTARKGVAKKHKNLVRVIQEAAKRAGLAVRVEVGAHELLLGDLSKEECRRIFPKRASVKYAQKFQAVIDALEQTASPACGMTEEQKRTHIQTLISELPKVSKDDRTGLRVDLSLENELTGEARWVDVTAIHTGCESYVKGEIRAVSRRQLTAGISSMMDVLDPNKMDPSPALAARETVKFQKYARLLHVATKQVAEGKRKKVPGFSAMAVSDYGEVGPKSRDLLEWIVHQFKLKSEADGARLDGCSVIQVVRDFRRRLYVDVQLALASGTGKMMCEAGGVWR